MAAPGDRRFAPGRGGRGLDPAKTCVLLIEFQNEFTTPGGKLHGGVKETMRAQNLLQNAQALVAGCRDLGIKVMYAPITFAADGSDNPQRYLGILGGCDSDALFTRGTWNAEICEALTPAPGDVIIEGKRGLSAFPNTTLQQELDSHGIETIALAGFMANCCVESTMREAFEKGYNLISLTDCVATTSMAGLKAALDITYPFFSLPLNHASFLANARAAKAQPPAPLTPAPAVDTLSSREWALRACGPGLFQGGPWFVDVRKSVWGGKLCTRSGEHELRRYLTFAEACGASTCGCVYVDRLAALPKNRDAPGDDSGAFGWLCNMTVGRLPGGGCLVYSPVLGADGSMSAVAAALEAEDLLPVRVVVAPSPQHHLCLQDFQDRWPDALLVCGKASGQMPPLVRKRRDLRFGGVLCAGSAELQAAVADAEGQAASGPSSAHTALWQEVCQVFEPLVVDDNRSGEIVLRHVPSKTLVLSDLLYKSNPKVVGPGGPENHYSRPTWFARGQEELFYAQPGDNSGGLLPSYRTHPKVRSIDIPGMRTALDRILAWDIEGAVACHSDPIEGPQAKELLRTAWQWVWD